MEKKNKMLHFVDFVFMTGLWLTPLVLLGLYKYISLTRPNEPVSSYPWLVMVLVSLMPPMYVYSGNLISAAAGKKAFGPEDTNIGRPSAYRSATGKERAMYPEIQPELVYREPVGIVLGKRIGKKKNEYVCKTLGNTFGGSHVLIIGGSGSGKSSGILLCSLIANPNVPCFCVDIKGELSSKSRHIDDPRTLIINPQGDRASTWGWDVFYTLRGTPSEQQILECMQGIAYSLIPLPADLKEPFWKVNARNLFIGLLVGYYKAGIRDFISIADQILETPPEESIERILSKAKPGAVERKYLGAYVNMAQETLSGIVSEMEEHLLITSEADIRYMLQVNPRKADPDMMIYSKYSLFLCLMENKLEAYYDLLQMVINSVFQACERRLEAEKDPCMIIIDELPRLCSNGKIERLLDGMHTLRSKNVNLVLATQSLEALESAYTKAQVSDILSNSSYIACLDVKSSETAKTVSSLCGTYKSKETTWNGSGTKGHITTAYHDRPIVEPADLSKLVLQNEVVLITPYGYFRVEKTSYFSDPFFKPKADEIKKYNDEIQRIEKIVHSPVENAEKV